MANELILIVEDDPQNLKLVRDTLQVKGYRTIEAGTGEEGAQLARDRQPALILMDIQLAGISGVEAFRQLRADPTTRAIPVIAVTASERQKIMPAGFDAFQGKPISVRELLETVEESSTSQQLHRVSGIRPRPNLSPTQNSGGGSRRWARWGAEAVVLIVLGLCGFTHRRDIPYLPTSPTLATRGPRSQAQPDGHEPCPSDRWALRSRQPRGPNDDATSWSDRAALLRANGGLPT